MTDADFLAVSVRLNALWPAHYPAALLREWKEAVGGMERAAVDDAISEHRDRCPHPPAVADVMAVLRRRVVPPEGAAAAARTSAYLGGIRADGAAAAETWSAMRQRLATLDPDHRAAVVDRAVEQVAARLPAFAAQARARREADRLVLMEAAELARAAAVPPPPAWAPSADEEHGEL